MLNFRIHSQEENMIFKLTVFAMAASLYYATQFLH